MKRDLPELRLPTLSKKAAAAVSYEIPPLAKKDWDRSVTALASENTITVFDVIGDFYDGGFSVARMSAALRSIGDKPVTVQINSPGGIYDDGLAIYNLLRAHPARVTTQVIGMAASAASIIAMAGDEIQIGKSAHMMIHNVQWVAVGDRHVMDEARQAMVIFDDTLADLYVERTGIEKAEVQAMMDAETYLAGQKAVDMGFADAFLPADPVKSNEAGGDKPLAYQVEEVLQEKGWSRAKCRRALKELRGTPGAVSNGMPGAADPEADDGLDNLRLAAARLSLVRA
jgi:ATP-dependent protease ClpP protease subunit